MNNFKEIPEYAQHIINEINDDRVKRGELPLREDEIRELLDKLEQIRGEY